MLLELKHTSS
jgi:hypothetical protein